MPIRLPVSLLLLLSPKKRSPSSAVPAAVMRYAAGREREEGSRKRLVWCGVCVRVRATCLFSVFFNRDI